jgi:D-alanyl-D-alanine carboxypeptidase
MRTTAAVPTVLLLVLFLAGCGGPHVPTGSEGDGALAAATRPADPPAGDTDGVAGGQGGADGDLGGARAGVDDDVPAITGLDPALHDALRRAASAARDDGVVVEVTSGWRSRGYQQRLLDEAVARYGSAAEAARWVATPDASAHVTGDAVDVGPTDAAYWMARHGADFGLCQVYANEIWHYELVAAADGTCPPQRADSSS